MSKDLYIFDLDGTLALHQHRLHLVTNDDKWDEFSQACVHDLPNTPVIAVLNRLVKRIRWLDGSVRQEGVEVFIFSGRSNLVFIKTIQWLREYTELSLEDIIDGLKMRDQGDNTPAEELKKRWYEELSEDDKRRLVCVFEDSPKVVAMWRSLGVTCAQVAEGNA